MPQGPLPPPPTRQEDDKMEQQQPTLSDEPQAECQAGKRQKEQMTTPVDRMADIKVSTATPKPKRSKTETHEGDPDAEMHPTAAEPTVTEHDTVATPIELGTSDNCRPRRTRSPTISPTQPHIQQQDRAAGSTMPHTRLLPSHECLEGHDPVSWISSPNYKKQKAL